jgi:L-malate glycosyltransferase
MPPSPYLRVSPSPRIRVTTAGEEGAMHILQVVSGRELDGVVVHCLLLCRELRRRNHRVTVACRPDSWIREHLRAEPFDVIESEVSHLEVRDLLSVARQARERGVEVIHSHHSAAHSCGVALRWLCGLPSVATAHHETIQLHWALNDYVIATSQHTRRYHIGHNLVRPSRIDIVHNFVDVASCEPPDSRKRSALRAEFGLSDLDLVIGFVGRVVPQKGLPYLLRALSAVIARLPSAKLLIIGPCSGTMRRRLDAIAEAEGVSGRVAWSSARNDVNRIRSVMDVFAAPSVWETSSLSVLESMAAGVPVVATAAGGTPECVSDGETGFLVPVGNPSALTDRIVRLLSDRDLCERMGEAGRRRVREHFSLKSQVPKVETVLARVVAVRRGWKRIRI